jgi:hypothetical protein
VQRRFTSEPLRTRPDHHWHSWHAPF